MVLLYFIPACLFGFFAVRALLHLRWARRLPSTPEGNGHPLPRCSVIIAARDEAERLPQTIEHILAQQGVDLELIVVDDRSTDQTPDILRRIAARDPRLKPIRIDVLPENWLGKCHACHVAAQHATGEWLLFTDADCWLSPRILARALTVAREQQVQHITLTPGVPAATLAARACQLAFLLSVLDWLARVNRDAPKGHLGIGAFNLVQAETYRKCGGHEALRLTVVEDVKLGLLIRRAGGRTRGFIGGGDAECHWGVTVPQFIKIMEKNYFAALDYRLWLALLVGLVLPVLWAASLLGPLSGTPGGWCSFLSQLLLMLPAAVLARRVRWPLRAAWLTPLIFPVLYFAILNSTWRTLRQGGIRWRDTFYPLGTLRAGNVQ